MFIETCISEQKADDDDYDIFAGNIYLTSCHNRRKSKLIKSILLIYVHVKVNIIHICVCYIRRPRNNNKTQNVQYNKLIEP